VQWQAHDDNSGTVAKLHSTLQRSFGFYLVWERGSLMAYEWDGRKARRGYIVKVLCTLGVALVTASLPTWLVIKAMSR
jgi:hypothetical protein